MATMIFRCPQDPEGCPASPVLRSCDTHKVKLEPARVETPAEEPRAEPGPAPGTAGPRTVYQRPDGAASSTPSAARPGRRPVIAVRLLGDLLVVKPEGLLIGRDEPDCAKVDGLAEYEQISRHHARLYWDGETLLVTDQRSTNGTFVNGRKAATPLPLRAGDVLRLAQDVEVPVFEIDENGELRSTP
ncbi:FHA domain-containing protein [Actinomadura geliboluensis]|uniref:FHA domain-containing protein n=1 Tax=Actinomadura geliboluensis TaxID=882440 RepID=UPI00369688FD